MLVGNRMGGSSDSNGAVGTLLQRSGSYGEHPMGEKCAPWHKSDRSPSASGQARLEPRDAGIGLPPARTPLGLGLQPVPATGVRAAMAQEHGMSTVTGR